MVLLMQSNVSSTVMSHRRCGLSSMIVRFLVITILSRDGIPGSMQGLYGPYATCSRKAIRSRSALLRLRPQRLTVTPTCITATRV